MVERKTTIPILSNILMETDQDQIWLTATDLELGIRCACPARIKKAGAGTIPARRLLDYVRLLPDADVQVKLAEGQAPAWFAGAPGLALRACRGRVFRSCRRCRSRLR